MELDGYAKSLHVAFEYHGAQHYVKNARFHSALHTLAQRRRDDARKRALCRQHRVKLIEIPYTVSHHDIERYIRSRLRAGQFHINKDPVLLDSLNAYDSRALANMRLIAKRFGGKCLSDAYINNSVKLKWRCRKGHVWLASPFAVKMGTWCPDCAGNRRLTLDHMRKLAEKRGGTCLATEYRGNKSKLRWRCARGHEWDAKPDNVSSGKWCPYCDLPPFTGTPSKRVQSYWYH